MWKSYVAAASLVVHAASYAQHYASAPSPDFWPTFSALALASLVSGGALAAACADAWFNRLPAQRAPLSDPATPCS